MYKGVCHDPLNIGAKPWFVPGSGECEVEVNVKNIVSSNVVLEEMSPSNLPPNIRNTRRLCFEKKAVKVLDESHAFTLDEMMHRDCLECDPNQACMDDDDVENDIAEEDSDDDEEEDEEEED